MKPYSYPSPSDARKRNPLFVIQFGLSAAVRQSPDGRLSQQINDGLDGAALDGASSGSAVLIGGFRCFYGVKYTTNLLSEGSLFQNPYSDYLATAAKKQIDYVCCSDKERTCTNDRVDVDVAYCPAYFHWCHLASRHF
jgi:hypothetical protein